MEHQQLKVENARIKAQLSLINDKIKALAVFSSRHDNALYLLINRINKKKLTENYDNLSTEIENTI